MTMLMQVGPDVTDATQAWTVQCHLNLTQVGCLWDTA